ncbi:MAG: protein rep [Clostridia bacterium]|nr:protein rep [Clostridia bacterium]
MDLEFYKKLNSYKTDSKSFSAMSRRIRVNAVTAEYYERLGKEYEDLCKTRGGVTKDFNVLISKRVGRVLRCGRFIDTVRFKELGIHEVKTIKLCGDKFCGNCQKQLANARERKYTPLLKELEKCFDIYHITLTVPNVGALFLPKAVRDIIDSFARLIKYISGRKKIRGINFGGFGYVGAIRSLEITHNLKRDDYHPHLHCIFAFKKGLNLDNPKVFVNAFSFNNGRCENKWSAFEVFIQKLWKLCYDGDRVTKTSIESSGGYSCKVNRADGNYHQIFKYVVKGLLDDKHAQQRKSKTGRIDNGLTYEEFKALFFALEGRRAMQGYGCFYGLKFDDSVLNEPDSSEAEIREIIHELRKMDTDEFVSEKLASVIENIVKKNEIYFSRKNIRDNLDSLKEE